MSGGQRETRCPPYKYFIGVEALAGGFIGVEALAGGFVGVEALAAMPLS